VSINDIQFGFRAGRGTTDVILNVMQIQKRFGRKVKGLVDGLYWPWKSVWQGIKGGSMVGFEAFRCWGMAGNGYQRYEGVTVAVKMNDEDVGLPLELFYTDDLHLLAKTEEDLMVKIKRWKEGMEGNGVERARLEYGYDGGYML
jgi:hypothetical protein